MGEYQRPVGAAEDRLTRVAQMVCNAVDLLNQAIDEIKGEKLGDDDDGAATRPPDGNPQQPR